MTRRRGKVDANQQDIVDTLRSIGATVQSLGDVGDGCPDLLVGYQGHNYLLEVKDGEKPPSARALTRAQNTWHRKWRGRVSVVIGVNTALLAIGVKPPKE